MPTSRSFPRARAVLPALVLTLAAALGGCGSAAPSAESPMHAMAAPPAPPMDAPVAPSAPADEEAGMRASLQPGPGLQVAQPAPAGAKSVGQDEGREIGDAPLIVYEGELAVKVEAGKGPASIDAIVAVATRGGWWSRCRRGASARR
jgi:hypothetical protein